MAPDREIIFIRIVSIVYTCIVVSLKAVGERKMNVLPH